MDWFLFDNDLRHERVKPDIKNQIRTNQLKLQINWRIMICQGIRKVHVVLTVKMFVYLFNIFSVSKENQPLKLIIFIFFYFNSSFFQNIFYFNIPAIPNLSNSFNCSKC